MPPMSCERASARVDDPAGGEHAEHARDAHLARERVDADVGELRAERVAGELLARLEELARVGGRLQALLGRLAAVLGELLAQRAAGQHDRRAPRRRARGAAGHARPREAAVADLDRAPAPRRPRARRRRSARAPCARPCRCRPPRSARRTRRRGARARPPATASGRPDTSRTRRPCRAASDPSRRAPGSGPRRSQPKRSAPSRRHATRLREEKRVPVLRVHVGVVADPQLDGSIPSSCASSSIADSSAYMPGHSPGARIHDGVGTSSDRELGGRCAGSAPRTSSASRSRSARRTPSAATSARRPRGRSPAGGRPRRRPAAAAGSSACGSRRRRTSAGAWSRP